MTAREAIKGLERLAKEFSGYKPNEEMFEMAIAALEKEAWKEEHPVSPLIKSFKTSSVDDSCMDCNERMLCNKYLNWLSDPKDIFKPKVNGCKKFNKDKN